MERPRYSYVRNRRRGDTALYEIEDAEAPTRFEIGRAIAFGMTIEHARLICDALNYHNENEVKRCISPVSLQ